MTSLVLCVDDDAQNLELVRRILSRRPEISLLTAADGERALELAVQELPALILLDGKLPGMSGEEVLRQLSEDSRTSTIPVVVISGDAYPERIAALRAAGATDYLTKPYRIAELLDIVDGLVGAP